MYIDYSKQKEVFFCLGRNSFILMLLEGVGSGGGGGGGSGKYWQVALKSL